VVVPAPAARRGEGGDRLLPRLLIFLPRAVLLPLWPRPRERELTAREDGGRRSSPGCAASGLREVVAGGGGDGRRSRGGERMAGGERRERVGGEPGVRKN
jgi:hypothetical protein